MRISDWSSDVCSSDLDHLNAPTIGMRLRYAQLLHQANIDDDVKVLVIRGAGDDFGTGQDLPEFMDAVRSEDGLLREVQLEGADVTYPGQRSFRHGAITTDPKRVGLGKRVSVRVDLGGHADLKKKKK